MGTNLVQGGVIVFGVVVCVMSIFGVCAPGRLIALVTSVWNKRGGVYIAVVVRLVLGALLILAAPGAKYPLAFSALGWLTILAAILIALTSRGRLDRFVGWWAARPPVMVRSWCLLGVVFGGVLVYGMS